MNDPILGQAKEALERLSADPVAQRIARDRERDELAHKFTLHKTREEGERELLRKQLVMKFGELPGTVEARLARADQAEVDRCAQRVLTESSLDKVLE